MPGILVMQKEGKNRRISEGCWQSASLTELEREEHHIPFSWVFTYTDMYTPNTHTHVHTCTWMHVCTHTHKHIQNIQTDTHREIKTDKKRFRESTQSPSAENDNY